MAYQAVLDARADVDTTILREALALRKEKQMHEDEDKVRVWEDYFYVDVHYIGLIEGRSNSPVAYSVDRVKAGKWEEDAYTSHSYTITHWVIKDRADIREPNPLMLVKADKLTEVLLDVEARVEKGKADFRYAIGELAAKFNDLTGETFSG